MSCLKMTKALDQQIACNMNDDNQPQIPSEVIKAAVTKTRYQFSVENGFSHEQMV